MSWVITKCLSLPAMSPFVIATGDCRTKTARVQHPWSLAYDFADAFTSHSEEEQVAGLYSLTESVRLAIAIEELCNPSDLSAVSVIHHVDRTANSDDL